MRSGKRTRVLFLAFCHKSSIQAQDRDAKNWASFLDPRKYDVSIFCKGEADSRLTRKKNVHIIYLNSSFKIPRVIKFLSYLLFVNYDVVVISKYDWISRNYVKWISPYQKRRQTLLGIVNQVPYGDKNFPSFIHGSKNIFAISTRIKDKIYELLGIDVPIVHLCYCLDLFQVKQYSNARPKVVSVGSLQMRKQPFFFADIAKETPEADFVWVGDGYYMSWMKEKIKTNRILNLKMIGEMVQDDLAKFLPGCDIFLFPSDHEGFPNVIVEAMACGLPVIASDIYQPEAVIDGKTGYVVKSKFEMLEKLKYLLSNEEILKDFGVNARKRAMDFEGSNIIHELEDCIDKTVGEVSNQHLMF